MVPEPLLCDHCGGRGRIETRTWMVACNHCTGTGWAPTTDLPAVAATDPDPAVPDRAAS